MAGNSAFCTRLFSYALYCDDRYGNFSKLPVIYGRHWSHDNGTSDKSCGIAYKDHDTRVRTFDLNRHRHSDRDVLNMMFEV